MNVDKTVWFDFLSFLNWRFSSTTEKALGQGISFFESTLGKCKPTSSNVEELTISKLRISPLMIIWDAVLRPFMKTTCIGIVSINRNIRLEGKADVCTRSSEIARSVGWLPFPGENLQGHWREANGGMRHFFVRLPLSLKIGLWERFAENANYTVCIKDTS